MPIRRQTAQEKELGILSPRQNEFIRLLTEGGLSKAAIARGGGPMIATQRRWFKDPIFIKAYQEQSKQYRKTGVDVAAMVKAAGGKKAARQGKPLTNDEYKQRKRALEDFHYFRERFLNRKSWKCQRDWIAFVEANEHSSIECPGRHGKSFTISVDYVTWCIVRDRNVLIGLYSKSSGLVEKWVGGIKRNLQKKSVVRAFGEFKPENPERWNRTEFEVIRPDIDDEDAVHSTVSAAGITSDIFGTKFNILILDDICGKDNVKTEEQRQNVVDIVTEALIPATQNGPVTERKVINIGTPMHPYDFLWWCKRNGDFECMKNVVVNWDTKLVLAPESKDYNTYSKIKTLKRRLGERAFNKRFMCHAVLDSDILFEERWFSDGTNYAKKYSYGSVPSDHVTVVTVDPATSQRKKASNLAIAGVSFVPGTNKRHLSDYFDDKLRLDLQAAKIVDMYVDLGAELVVVEKNACQAYLGELIRLEAERRGISVRVELSFTGSDKTTTEDRLGDIVGVERLAPLFEHGNYKLPYNDEEDRLKTARLTDKLKVATLQEVPDILMAMWFGEKYIGELNRKVIRLRKRPDLSPCLRSA